MHYIIQFVFEGKVLAITEVYPRSQEEATLLQRAIDEPEVVTLSLKVGEDMWAAGEVCTQEFIDATFVDAGF